MTQRYSDLKPENRAKYVITDRFRIDGIEYEWKAPYELESLERHYNEPVFATRVLAASETDNLLILGEQLFYTRDTTLALKIDPNELPNNLDRLRGDLLRFRSGPGLYAAERASYDFIMHNGSPIDLPERINITGEGQKTPYATFAEEKEDRKNKSKGWGRTGVVDSDIRQIIELLNGSEFSYTLFQSCSGTPKDHFGEYPSYPLCSYGRKGGFIPLRLKIDDLRAADMLERLLNEGVRVLENVPEDAGRQELQEDSAVKTGIIRPDVPEEVFNPSHSEHLTYLSERWAKITELIQTAIK
jgi:hypothetical protein